MRKQEPEGEGKPVDPAVALQDLVLQARTKHMGKRCPVRNNTTKSKGSSEWFSCGSGLTILQCYCISLQKGALALVIIFEKSHKNLTQMGIIPAVPRNTDCPFVLQVQRCSVAPANFFMGYQCTLEQGDDISTSCVACCLLALFQENEEEMPQSPLPRASSVQGHRSSKRS